MHSPHHFLTGTATGAILLMAALGLTLTFGQMGVINMANGEFLMVGAYVGVRHAAGGQQPGPLHRGRPPDGVRRRRSAGVAPRGLDHPMDVPAPSRHPARDRRRVVGPPAARSGHLRRPGRPGHRAELAGWPHLGVRLRVAPPPAVHDRVGHRCARRPQRRAEVHVVRSTDPGDGAEPGAGRDPGRVDTQASTASPSSSARAWRASAASPSPSSRARTRRSARRTSSPRSSSSSSVASGSSRAP